MEDTGNIDQEKWELMQWRGLAGWLYEKVERVRKCAPWELRDEINSDLLASLILGNYDE